MYTDCVFQNFTFRFPLVSDFDPDPLREKIFEAEKKLDCPSKSSFFKKWIDKIVRTLPANLEIRNFRAQEVNREVPPTPPSNLPRHDLLQKIWQSKKRPFLGFLCYMNTFST